MEIKYSYQNNGETYMKLKIEHQIYTIRGFSRAGLRTSILIDEFNIVFDMGYSNERSFCYDNKLITHGHADHIGALHIDHCARKLYSINKQKLYIMPYQCIKPFKLIVSGISEMNCGKNGENIKLLDNLLLTDIIASEECINEYKHLIGKSNLQSEYVVKSILMDHKIKSFGYIIYRKTKKLKQEYITLNREEIIKIKQTCKIENKNIDDTLTEIHYTPLVGYTGDTTINGLIYNQEFLDVPLLIMECTGFSENDKLDTLEGKHIHYDDIINNSTIFNNKQIILFHFSQQYKTLNDILLYINNTNEINNKIIYFF